MNVIGICQLCRIRVSVWHAHTWCQTLRTTTAPHPSPPQPPLWEQPLSNKFFVCFCTECFILCLYRLKDTLGLDRPRMVQLFLIRLEF